MRERVERTAQAGQRASCDVAVVHVEADHLAERMHARIGPVSYTHLDVYKRQTRALRGLPSHSPTLRYLFHAEHSRCPVLTDSMPPYVHGGMRQHPSMPI